MGQEVPSDRLLAIIELQNEITSGGLDPDAAMALVATRARELIGASAGMVELVDGEELVCRAASGDAQPNLGLRLHTDAGLSGRCVATNEVLLCEDARIDPRVAGGACDRMGAAAIASAPVRQAGSVVGVLTVCDSHPRTFDRVDSESLALLAAVIAAQMTAARRLLDEREGGGHDVLTGLPNRPSFDERLAAAGARTRRHGSKIALCLLDLDRFEKINDTHGRAAGDDVLRAVAAHLVTVRGEDAAFRIGGDEFALLLEETAEAGARQVARRLALSIRADPACDGIGVSWGVAMVSGDPPGSAARADAALAEAKRASQPASDAD